jgi:hypothetical protein
MRKAGNPTLAKDSPCQPERSAGSAKEAPASSERLEHPRRCARSARRLGPDEVHDPRAVDHRARRALRPSVVVHRPRAGVGDQGWRPGLRGRRVGRDATRDLRERADVRGDTRSASLRRARERGGRLRRRNDARYRRAEIVVWVKVCERAAPVAPSSSPRGLANRRRGVIRRWRCMVTLPC